MNINNPVDVMLIGLATIMLLVLFMLVGTVIRGKMFENITIKSLFYSLLVTVFWLSILLSGLYLTGIATLTLAKLIGGL